MFGDRVDLPYNLSSTDRWTYREGQQDFGGYVEDLCHASTEEMEGVPCIGRVFLQQWLLGVT